MTTEKTLVLPASQDQSRTTELKIKGSLLLIGANGSGKTRLGTWIEIDSMGFQKHPVHRISAQKSLSMLDNVTPMAVNIAEKNLLYGILYDQIQFTSPYDSERFEKEFEQNKSAFKIQNRWKQKPAVQSLDDYEALMIYLFSETIEKNNEYCKRSKKSKEKVEPLLTKLDRVKQIWETILPHRELIIGGLDIKTRVKDAANKTYKSSEMSDGERVIFYLIGQCLAAPKDGIIIIDEPELHLQKSIQVPLWAEIEMARQDCLFVYLTHDVDFAAAQVNAEKIWLKSYDGNNWKWEKIETVDNLPEELLIEILGSRKPIVFVEGENGKFDVTLYRLILDKFLVIPRGSCTHVIQSVKALKNSPQLHHLEVYGIIDRDRRTVPEIEVLIKDGIYVLEVAEVENLFCTPEILKFVSQKLARDVETDFTIVKNHIFQQFEQELENQTCLRTANEVKFKLNDFNEKVKGKSGLEEEFNRIIKNINIAEIHESSNALFLTIVEEQDYDKLLGYYNRKSLAKQISGAFGLKNNELVESIIRYAQKNDSDRNTIKSGLKKYFGKFANHID
jgi:hypothetical protein